MSGLLPPEHARPLISRMEFVFGINLQSHAEPRLVRLGSSSGHGQQANCTKSLWKICGPRVRLGRQSKSSQLRSITQQVLSLSLRICHCTPFLPASASSMAMVLRLQNGLSLDQGADLKRVSE